MTKSRGASSPASFWGVLRLQLCNLLATRRGRADWSKPLTALERTRQSYALSYRTPDLHIVPQIGQSIRVAGKAYRDDSGFIGAGRCIITRHLAMKVFRNSVRR